MALPTRHAHTTNSVQTLVSMLASSRPLQATLSITQPLLAAMIGFGTLLPLDALLLVGLGSLTGMFAVFALNDFLDFPLDRKGDQKLSKKNWDIDSALMLHPYAEGAISRNQQLIWIGINTLITVYILRILSTNALTLFFVALALELLYCYLSTRTEWKTVIAGLLVAVGGLIGWFAVGAPMNIPLLLSVGAFLFFWEIGGRNIPNDLSDRIPDAKKGIRTLATQYGPELPAQLAFVLVILTIFSALAIGMLANLGMIYAAIVAATGVGLLILPNLTLIQQSTHEEALRYFNKASLYPVVIFLAAALAYFIGKI